jgi:hypothetical protein
MLCCFSGQSRLGAAPWGSPDGGMARVGALLATPAKLKF